MSDERPQAAIAWTTAAVALTVTWLAVNAVWGLTDDDETLLSSTLARIFALRYWVVIGLLATLAVGDRGRFFRTRGLQAFGLMLFTYLAGVAISQYAYAWIDPRGGVPIESYFDTIPALWERSFLLWPAVPMCVVYLALLRKHDPNPLRFGTWRARWEGEGNAGNGKSWLGRMGGFIAFVVVPLAVYMQLTVGFGPARSGTMFVFIIPLAVLALFNGFTEELLFRGFLQSSFTRYLGPRAGVVAQGLFFGFHHWGASPDLIAGLPTAIVLCGFGVYWGYSVHATGGIGWAVCAHSLVDLTFFSAHFVNTA